LSNSDTLAALRQLRIRFASSQIDVEEASKEFERLTFTLSGVATEDERVLKGLTNDIERIRFTLLPENQPGAVEEVLLQSEEVFERYV
jgi:hypothetical protein